VKVLKEKDIVKERPNKYILLYGKSLEDIANYFGVSKATIHNWLRNPKKKKWLDDKLREVK
jgi:transposase